MRHKLHTSPEPTPSRNCVCGVRLVTTDIQNNRTLNWCHLLCKFRIGKSSSLVNVPATSQPTLSVARLLIDKQGRNPKPPGFEGRPSRAQFPCEYNSHMIIFMVMTDDAPLPPTTHYKLNVRWVQMKAKDQLMNLYINRSFAQLQQLFFTAIHCDNTSPRPHLIRGGK